ncbi:class II aldolase/adducin family protein [Sphingopyxis macrogoltabida]|uniref:Aldolase n=1 Tax=Sphingopyxis macrogoltabida TaxID=33050 RepID=A0AAC9AZR1_SPHMC|nr:class II aldolase/adducin family protein [Sphingopyxis macrogoltabida]ALJ16532.1 aldolase [Sphingopyxis macrogoltabida]AMU92764.1 aldolase [Sphingopyxis macrogoltabida]
MTTPAAIDEQVRLAARALASAGLVHAFGHCSARLDATSFLVCAPLPMGRVADEPGTVVPLDGPLPEGVLGEVRIHREIYRRRSGVGGVCRIMPPAVMALSAAGLVPVPRHGIGAYFKSIPFWNDPRLLRSDAAAADLADMLGDAPALVMRGNGAVVVGESLPQAVTLGWFLEDAARIERDVRAMGLDLEAARLTSEEIDARQTWSGGVVERMWRHLTGDML